MISGVTEKTDESGNVQVSYMMRSNRLNNHQWMLPEELTSYLTPKTQIIKVDFPVEYSCITIVRCKISKETISEINAAFNDYVKTL